MEWGGGVIGWQASDSEYKSHTVSGRSDSNAIGCLYCTTYSAVVYRITREFNQVESQFCNNNIIILIKKRIEWPLVIPFKQFCCNNYVPNSKVSALIMCNMCPQITVLMFYVYFTADCYSDDRVGA